jgi:hypothetical protein
VQRARASGSCPPSLLNDALVQVTNDDRFESDLFRILDSSGRYNRYRSTLPVAVTTVAIYHCFVGFLVRIVAAKRPLTSDFFPILVF